MFYRLVVMDIFGGKGRCVGRNVVRPIMLLKLIICVIKRTGFIKCDLGEIHMGVGRRYMHGRFNLLKIIVFLQINFACWYEHVIFEHANSEMH